MKSAGCMQTDTFAWHFFLHPSLLLSADSSHALAHVCVRPNVQMACLEHTIPQVWLALVGRQAARDAALPVHRSLVPSGRGRVQGKIKGRGTSLCESPVCTWGWRGTRLIAAPCCEIGQRLAGIGESACFARRTTPALDGGAT